MCPWDAGKCSITEEGCSVWLNRVPRCGGGWSEAADGTVTLKHLFFVFSPSGFQRTDLQFNRVWLAKSKLSSSRIRTNIVRKSDAQIHTSTISCGFGSVALIHVAFTRRARSSEPIAQCSTGQKSGAKQIQPDQAETFYMYVYISVVYIMYVFWIVDLQTPTVLPRHEAGPFTYLSQQASPSHAHVNCASGSHTVCVDIWNMHETCITRQEFSENWGFFFSFFLSSAH